ncbi:MAG: FAD-binding oxidoreductase [Gemmatimonadaceae bacterium]
MPDEPARGPRPRVEVSRDESVRLAYSRDVSGLELVPEGVVRPTSAEEIVELLHEASAAGTPVTPAGGQTSTTGASITDRGLLLSLRAMDRVLDVDVAGRVARVQPGVLLGDLKRRVAEEGLLFAPDPTSEEDTTIGGAVACNASGARTLRYGATRSHVRALTVALASGEVVELRRRPLEKNTVGYAVAHDPVDWFVGSEGTLGVTLEAELALLPRPAAVLGLAVPFAGEADALAFVVAARDDAHLAPRCLEFFDRLAFEIVRGAAADAGWAPDADALVYLEDDAEEPPLDRWLALAEAHGAAAADIRAYGSEGELKEARRLRHAVPATMNERGGARRAHGGRKVSTDWAVPHRELAGAIHFARAVAERHGVPQAVIYGHAGNGHPHQNFIAHDADELRRIEAVVEETLRHVIALGGTVAAEHGVGKIKRKWVGLQLSPLQIGAMRALKRELDPGGILSPGNVL